MYLYFDIDTTSLIPGQICRLAYIADEGNAVLAKNFFFSADRVDPGCRRVHKLSVRRLETLSNGERFKDRAAEIAADFAAADLVIAHNIRFDLAFLTKEFERAKTPLVIKKRLCTMEYFTPLCRLSGNARNTYKYPKLAELAAYFGIGEAEAAALAADVFGTQAAALCDAQNDTLRNAVAEAETAHDARRDVALMYLCVKAALKNGVVIE
ncbi:MAG: hypothetical protein LBQ40_07160 [Clostridiales bacterium]|jgi:DNA polymerase-3 subunit epsilon|nr:hypothetical protein [Clostridiales bacterium]